MWKYFFICKNCFFVVFLLSAVGISVQCPTKRYVVILFQPVTLTCNYQTTATQSPVVTWKYKSYCRDPIQAALNPSSADSILSQNNPNFDANIECADSQRTVRIVASKQGNAVTLGADYQGRKISILNSESRWHTEKSNTLCQNLRKSNTTDLLPGIDLLVMEDWLLVVLVVLGFLLLLLLIGICWCQCCPHTCCCYVSCPCCPERCCCPRALYEAGKAVKKGGVPMSQYAATLYAPSMYAQPAYAGTTYGGPPSHHPGMPMLPVPNGSGPPPPHNGYGRDYDGASSGESRFAVLIEHPRSGYRIQVDPDGNATRAIYYMERELANMDPSRPGNYNRLFARQPPSSQDPEEPLQARPPLATVYDRDEAMSTISSVSQQGQRHGGGGGYPGDRMRARSMDNLDDIGRRYGRDDPPPNRRPEEFRGRRGSDDGWSSSARSGNSRDFDDRRRREPSPDRSRRGDDGRYRGMEGRRSRSRDDLMELARERERGGDARGRRDDYDDGLLREAMERKKLGEQQRARSRERLDSESDRSDRARAPRGPPPLPHTPPSGHPARRGDYPPPPPPVYSDDESMSSSKRSNLRKVSRGRLYVHKVS
uniref:LISCH7 domain-containing protein n=1 Tax=Gasterosteus aculeatus aculeatus TaxID=481459 RepID=A0AAQ4R0L9_GASAC